VKAVASRARELMKEEPNVLQLKSTPSSPLVVSLNKKEAFVYTYVCACVCMCVMQLVRSQCFETGKLFTSWLVCYSVRIATTFISILI